MLITRPYKTQKSWISGVPTTIGEPHRARRRLAVVGAGGIVAVAALALSPFLRAIADGTGELVEDWDRQEMLSYNASDIVSSVTDYVTAERLARTPENERLLRMSPHPGAKESWTVDGDF